VLVPLVGFPCVEKRPRQEDLPSLPDLKLEVDTVFLLDVVTLFDMNSMRHMIIGYNAASVIA
jgi:hypothetical protein